MKRDCGTGELIPIQFRLAYCIGQADREHKATYATLPLARIAFEAKVTDLKQTPYSNICLYAEDRKGYANCILSAIVTTGGIQYGPDRTTEL